jgi:HEAT repeat protein
VLGEIGANDDGVCDRLALHLNGSHRLAVLQSLGMGQGGSRDVVQKLLTMVGFSNEPAEVALALAALNMRAKRIQELGPEVVARVNDRDPAVRQQSVELVGRVSRPTPVLVETIRLRLNDAHEPVRAEAIRTLGWFGPASRPALAELKALAKHSNPVIRKRVAQALERIESIP